MDLVVIHNPKAGVRSWSQERVGRLLREAGHAVRIISRRTDWREVLRERPDAFVAAGGDGTVNQVIRALAGRSEPVAILPFGTANNVANALGYRTTDDLAERVAAWPAHEQTLQLARAERGGHRALFVEAAGMGAFADMVSQSEELELKDPRPIALLNIRRKLVEKLLAAQPMLISAQVDGVCVQGEYLLFECLNLPIYGPRLRLAPRESAAAQQVTLCGIDAAAVDAAAEWMSTGEGDPEAWVLGRGRTLEIVSDKAAHVDGELWPGINRHTHPLHIHAGAQQVRVWI